LLWLRKTHVGSAATRNCPKTAREPHKTPNAPAVALKLVRTPRRTPLHPLPGSAMVAQQPSDPIDEHDRDQPGALRYVARPASAAQRGGGEAAPALRACVARIVAWRGRFKCPGRAVNYEVVE